MADERDMLDQQAQELEAKILEEDIESPEDRDQELARLAVLPAGERARLLAERIVSRLEQRKDAPEAMGEALMDKYLSMGRELLSQDSGAALDPQLRDRVEDLVGEDVSGVRVHTGETAAKAAEALGARAFALGSKDIYFGRDQFRPNTSEGLGVLVHELTHATDNSVGAAFKATDSAGDYSAAEDRAEVAEARARQSAEGGEGEGGEKEDDEDIDIKKLTSEVQKLADRARRRSADRTGSSGH